MISLRLPHGKIQINLALKSYSVPVRCNPVSTLTVRGFSCRPIAACHASTTARIDFHSHTDGNY